MERVVAARSAGYRWVPRRTGESSEGVAPARPWLSVRWHLVEALGDRVGIEDGFDDFEATVTRTDPARAASLPGFGVSARCGVGSGGEQGQGECSLLGSIGEIPAEIACQSAGDGEAESEPCGCARLASRLIRLEDA